MSSLSPASERTAPVSSPPLLGSVPDYYSPGGRDLRIDLLRGLFVLVMIVDHIAGASPLYLLTGGGRFLTSAAEGFILISGYTAGLVYRRLILRDGIVASMMKALSRAFSLYLLTIGLTLLLVPLSEALKLPWSTGLDLDRSLKFVISVLTLHRTYTYIDIMLLYTLLFLVLPLALLLIEQKRTWLLLLASWLLWLIYQVYPEPAAFPWQIAQNHQFPFATWQVLFFTTLVLGYSRERLPRPGTSTLNRLHLLTGIAFAALIGVSYLLHLPANRLPAQLGQLSGTWASSQAWILANLFDKPSVGPGRLFASAAVFGFLLLSLMRWWRPFSRGLQGLLLPLGQHALYAWSAHIFTIVGIGLVVRALGANENNPWLAAGLQVGAVGLVWIFTRRQTLAVTPRSRRYWYATPAVLALLTLLVLQLPYFDGAGRPPAAAAATELAPVQLAP